MPFDTVGGSLVIHSGLVIGTNAEEVIIFALPTYPDFKISFRVSYSTDFTSVGSTEVDEDRNGVVNAIVLLKRAFSEEFTTNNGVQFAQSAGDTYYFAYRLQVIGAVEDHNFILEYNILLRKSL